MTKEKRDEIRRLGHENDPPKRHFNVSPGRQGNWGPPWPLPDEFDDIGVENLAQAVIEQVANDYRHRRDLERTRKEIWRHKDSSSRPLGRFAEKIFFQSQDFSFWAAGTSLSGEQVFRTLEKHEDEKDQEMRDIWKKLCAGEKLGPYENPPWWWPVFNYSSGVEKLGKPPRLFFIKRRQKDEDRN